MRKGKDKKVKLKKVMKTPIWMMLLFGAKIANMVDITNILWIGS